TIGPIGFLGLQAGYGLSTITGISNSLNVHITIIILLVIAAAISAVTGIHKGIQILSSFNVLLAVGLIIGVLIFGPVLFIFNNYFEAFGLYVNKFITFNTYLSNDALIGLCKDYFFAWLVGYDPLLLVFEARIVSDRP